MKRDHDLKLSIRWGVISFVRNPLLSETKICLIDPRGRGGALSGGFLLLH